MAERQRKRPTPTASQLALTAGDTVEVTLDDGSTVTDVLVDPPSKLGGHTWVAWLGKLGSYQLTRCRKLDVRPL